jgi:scyllo-inositol 2-dehydrogenase (NADP+)
VLVLTPLPLNAPTAGAAIRAGKHVIMEKPIARSVAEGRALIAEARHAGLRLYVTEQSAYRRAGTMLAELIGAGEIGDLVMWNQVMHMEGDRAQGDLRFETTPWRKQADFPLGTMFDGGIHTIAALSQVFGVPATAAASGVQLRPEYGAYDQVSAHFTYANGTSGMLSHSSYLHPGGNHFHIYGSAGVIRVERERLVVSRPDEPERSIEAPGENSYHSMWHAIAQAIAERRDPPYTPEDALNDVATLEAVARAIESGGRAQVDVTPLPTA